MKKIVYPILTMLVLSLFFNHSIEAQGAYEGTVIYAQSMNFTKMMASLDYLTQNQREQVTYMGGNRRNWTQYKQLHFNQKLSKYEDSEDTGNQEMRRWSRKKEMYFVLNNFTDNTLHSVFGFNDKSYIISDSLYFPVWKIKNNLKEIAGHMCMNAYMYDTIRQQNVDAWFALDIPVSAGPDRFSGLPGLILEVDINDGAMILTAERIESIADPKVFEIPNKIKGKEITLTEFNKTLKDYIDEKRKVEQPWFFGVPY